RAAPILCGAAVSETAQTGQSDAIHSPEECASTVVRRMRPASVSIAVVCTVAISCWLKVFRRISSPVASDAYRNVRLSSRGKGEWIVAGLSGFLCEAGYPSCIHEAFVEH